MLAVVLGEGGTGIAARGQDIGRGAEIRHHGLDAARNAQRVVVGGCEWLRRVGEIVTVDPVRAPANIDNDRWAHDKRVAKLDVRVVIRDVPGAARSPTAETAERGRRAEPLAVLSEWAGCFDVTD